MQRKEILFCNLTILKNNKELKSWWEEHQEKDRKEAARLASIERKKKIKQKALSKLTSEERKALGL